MISPMILKHSTILFFSTLFFASFAHSSSAPIESHTLNNGLKVIVKQDTRSPIFYSQIWYKVGGSDERWPYTGISHMLEHMMFKGTTKYPSGKFSQIVANNGGEENAFTSKDFTAYYQKMNKSQLELALSLEADRMQNLVFNPEDFKKERQVVIEERRLRIDDNPHAKTYEKLNDISFGYGPYKTPVIGFYDDINNLTIDSLKKWYSKYYTPDNAVLVVAGDVVPENVFNLAQKHFAHLKPSTKPTKPSFKSRGLIKNSDLVIADTNLPLYTMSFFVPSLSTASPASDAYELEMLAHLLNDLFIKEFVRKETIFTDIGVNYGLYDKYSTLITIGFIPENDISIKDGIQKIKNLITKVTSNSTDIDFKSIIKKIIVGIETSRIYKQDSIDNQAHHIGMLESIGLGHEVYNDYTSNMRAVTPDALGKAANKWLNFDNMNTVELKLLEKK